MGNGEGWMIGQWRGLGDWSMERAGDWAMERAG